MTDPAPNEEAPRSRLARLSKAYAVQSAEGIDRVLETPAGYSGTVERILELSRAMVGIHDRAELLEFVSDGLRELFDAQNSFVVLFDAHGVPRIQTAHTASPSGETWPVSDTILERVRESRGPLVIDDTSVHPDLRDRRSVEALGIASVLCAPLIVDERVIGVLQFDHRGERHSFPIGDLGLLSMFAGQVGTAFRNLELIEQLAGALAETRAAQERVVQAERLAALGELAGGIAHDFNNSLFVTLGTCEVLLAGDQLRERERDAILRIQTCSNDAAETVRRLALFARGRPRENAEREPVDLREIASAIPELTRRKWEDEAGSRGVSIEFRTRLDATGHVAADPSELRESLINLVFNAVEATESDGAITLATGAEDGEAWVSVSDEGRGMDFATRQRVFEPFFSTKGERGHGLGLSTTWRLVQMMGGRIDVDSRPCEGARFVVRLPQVASRTAPLERAVPAIPAGLRVLAVDDDRDVLATLNGLLRATGARIETHLDPVVALERAIAGEFDVVLTDLKMPGLDGLEFARRLSTARPNLPIVLLTGWDADPRADPGGAGAPIAAVLCKPISLGGLSEALTGVLGARASTTEPG